MTRRSVSGLDQARRVFERHALASAPLMITGVAVGWYLATHGHLVVGTAAVLGPAGLLAAVLWTAPERRLRRLEHRARAYLPAADGLVALRGRVAAVAQPIQVPAGGGSGGAYWWRLVDNSEGVAATSDEAWGVTDFVVRCGDHLVAVDATRARVLFDPRRASVSDKDDHGWTESQVARVGDEIVVEGWLHRGTTADPLRAAATLSAPGKRGTTVGLIAAPGTSTDKAT